ELLDAHRGGERLLALQAHQGVAGLLVREVQADRAARDETPAHEQHDEGEVFLEQPRPAACHLPSARDRNYCFGRTAYGPPMRPACELFTYTARRGKRRVPRPPATARMRLIVMTVTTGAAITTRSANSFTKLIWVSRIGCRWGQPTQERHAGRRSMAGWKRRGSDESGVKNHANCKTYPTPV